MGQYQITWFYYVALFIYCLNYAYIYHVDSEPQMLDACLGKEIIVMDSSLHQLTAASAKQRAGRWQLPAISRHLSSASYQLPVDNKLARYFYVLDEGLLHRA